MRGKTVPLRPDFSKKLFPRNKQRKTAVLLTPFSKGFEEHFSAMESRCGCCCRKQKITFNVGDRSTFVSCFYISPTLNVIRTFAFSIENVVRKYKEQGMGGSIKQYDNFFQLSLLANTTRRIFPASGVEISNPLRHRLCRSLVCVEVKRKVLTFAVSTFLDSTVYF